MSKIPTYLPDPMLRRWTKGSSLPDPQEPVAGAKPDCWHSEIHDGRCYVPFNEARDTALSLQAEIGSWKDKWIELGLTWGETVGRANALEKQRDALADELFRVRLKFPLEHALTSAYHYEASLTGREIERLDSALRLAGRLPGPEGED